MIEILTAKLNYKVLLLLVSINTCQASNSVLQSELPPNGISKMQNSPWEGLRLSLITFTFTPIPLCQMNIMLKYILMWLDNQRSLVTLSRHSDNNLSIAFIAEMYSNRHYFVVNTQSRANFHLNASTKFTMVSYICLVYGFFCCLRTN